MCELSLPAAFMEQMRSLLQGDADAFFASYEAPSLRGIRFRDGRHPLPEEQLTGRIPYARSGFYLDAFSDAGSLPLHEAGAYYIQEPSAMAAAAVLQPRDGDRVLDLCAAPGGKSTQLAMSADLKMLVSNEPIPSRAQILSRNIERMGIGNAIVTCAYPDRLAAAWPGYFDKILVDAPCSGEGMFRRHPETRAEWDADAPQRCHERQMEILRSAAKMLRPGGQMVFSTCTFNSIENEGTIQAFFTEHPDFHLLPIQIDGLPEAPDGMLRLWPHRFPGEGHFVALLEKAEGESASIPSASLTAPQKNALAAYRDFAKQVCCGILPNVQQGDRLYHVPDGLPPLNGIKVLRMGLHLGEMRGRVFLPDHALALACDGMRGFAVEERQAVSYQHGDTLDCDEKLSGFYAITYQGYTLGFGKASNGQMKNHYPKGLRK